MFDTWYELPPLLRAGLGLVLIGVAVFMFYGGSRRGTIYVGAVGMAMLLFSGAGNNSKGYRF